MWPFENDGERCDESVGNHTGERSHIHDAMRVM